MHKSALVDAGRLEHTYGSSPGQRLKSPANQGIAESEWHEPIHHILRKAILRHTPCHKGLGSCIQVLASHLQHLSWFQDAWPGQMHASKQRTSIYSMVHLQEVTVCDVMWTRPDFSPMPRNSLIFRRKMRSSHKTGQHNLWRSNSNHPKANQSQNTSHSIVAGAHRKQWGHILEDQQRRNVGKLHGLVRKGPPPHLFTWKPEPRGYSSFDHGTCRIRFQLASLANAPWTNRFQPNCAPWSCYAMDETCLSATKEFQGQLFGEKYDGYG